MKSSDPALSFSRLSLLAVFVFLLFQFSQTVFAQGGNTISGHVFGIDRRPLPDIHVELLDDLSRTINRGRTNASGRYFFYGLSAGRFAVRIMPLGTDYEEQEQPVEIVNFTRGTGSGDSRLAGYSNEQKDFYLRLRRGATNPSAAGLIFAQEVPEKARELYDTAVAQLENKKPQEAYTALKASLEIFPKYFAALELLGTEYVKAGHFEAARLLLLLAVDVNPRAYKSWHGVAIALYSQKKYSEALTAVEKAVEINAFAPESLLLAGSLYRLAKKYDEAEKRLNKAKEISRDSIPDVHWELALLYGNGLKRYKEAARELKIFLKLRPDHQDAANIKKLIVEFESKAKTT